MTLYERYEKALHQLRKLKPHIYSPAKVQANLKAAKTMSDAQLEYYVLSAENNVGVTQSK